MTDAATLASFVRDRGVPNVIDFPLQDSLVRYAGGSAGRARHLHPPRRRRLLPARGRRRADARDLPRKPRRRPRGAEDQGAGRGRRRRAATARPPRPRLLYFLRGAPAVYYGDEVGMIGRGGDKAARQDMFPTSVAEWQKRGARRLAADRQRLVVRRRSSHPVAARLRVLAALRDAHPALATGATFVRVAREGCSASAVSTVARAASTSPSSTRGRSRRASRCRPRLLRRRGRPLSGCRTRRAPTRPGGSHSCSGRLGDSPTRGLGSSATRRARA